MRTVLAAMLLAGCYKPTVASCQLTCAADRSCPDGFSCSTANHCVATGEADQCSGIVVDGAAPGDLGIDMSLGIDAMPCAFAVSNISGSVCALLGSNPTGELDVGSGMAIITGMVGDPVFPPMGTFGLAVDDVGVQIVVVVVTKLVIAQGVQLAVTGDRPLLLISLGGVDIQGEIDVVGTSIGATDCASAEKPATGGGGGGAGYGAPGGSGGAASTGVSGVAGMAESGTATLVPLRPGCVGSTGGRLASGGLGGAAGGALELAAHDELRIEQHGLVRVNGTGGDGNAGLAGGAGGGGSGGSLFLEAGLVVLDSGATLCANGGPGGSTNSTNAPTTPSTSCTATPTQPTQIGAVVVGGVGGASGGAAGAGGVGNTMSSSGGGGGGGGVGRIHLHGQVTDLGSQTSPFPE